MEELLSVVDANPCKGLSKFCESGTPCGYPDSPQSTAEFEHVREEMPDRSRSARIGEEFCRDVHGPRRRRPDI